MSAHDNTERWHAALDRLQRSGEPHVLASVVGAAGSTPREPGAKLVVTRDAVIDTLGGGHFEQQIVELARARLALAAVVAETRLEAFPLGGRSGQCCGGFVHVLLEVFPGAEQRLALFGAGHVGQALVAVMAPLPWRIDWYDTRDDAFAAGTPLPARVHPMRWRFDPGAPAEVVAGIAPGAHVLVMTHDHAQDRALVEALLARRDLASLGLIGSDSKWASFRQRLRQAGIDESELARVRCPIGKAGGAFAARGKRPHEIAISAAAELLALAPSPPRPERRGVAPDVLRDAFAPRPERGPTDDSRTGTPT